jgi:hypothetical protein
LSPLHARPSPTCRSDRANTLCRTRTFNSARAPRDWRGLYGSPHGSSMRRPAEPRSAKRRARFFQASFAPLERCMEYP